jgi:hypothetical protein
MTPRARAIWSRLMRKRLAFLAIYALHPAVASAQPMQSASLRVERSAEEACPDERAIRAEVDRRLGRASFAEGAPRSIVVEYRPSLRGRRRARITVREGTAEAPVRDLSQDGPSCEALSEAVALAVALVIDPDAALRPAPPVPAAPAVTPAVPITCPEAPAPSCPECAACPSPPPPVAAPAPRRSLPASWIALSGGVAIGVAPAPSLSVGISAMVPLRGHWSLDLGASYLPPVTTRDGTTSIGRTVARVGGCLDTTPTWMQLGFCAGVLGGAMHLVALSLQPVDPGDRVWLGASAEFHARLLPGDRWVISAQVRPVVPLLTWAPRVEGASSPSFSPWPVAIEADLAVGVRLP